MRVQAEVQKYMRQLGSTKTSDRQSAAEALGKLGDPSAVEPLIKTLHDRDSGVRRRAAEALGKLGGAYAAGDLVRAMRDWDSTVCRAATEALIELGECAVEGLNKALDDIIIRDKAAKALIDLGECAVKPLIAALSNTNSHVRDAAAESLAEIGDLRAAAPLFNTRGVYLSYKAQQTLGSKARDRVRDAARGFFASHGTTWDHQAWLRFLYGVRTTIPVSLLSDAEVGKLLEGERSALGSRAAHRPMPADPQSETKSLPRAAGSQQVPNTAANGDGNTSLLKRLFGGRSTPSTAGSQVSGEPLRTFRVWYRYRAAAERVIARDPTGFYPDLLVLMAHKRTPQIEWDAISDAVRRGHHHIEPRVHDGDDGYELVIAY